MPKQFEGWGIGLLIAIALIFAGKTFLGSTVQLIPDNFQYYDDFITGIRYDLWNVHYHHSQLGATRFDAGTYLELYNQDIAAKGYSGVVSTTYGYLQLIGDDSGISNLNRYSEVTSIKKFESEDIKMKVTLLYSASPTSRTFYSINYGDTNIILPEPTIVGDCYKGCSGVASHIIEIKRYSDLDINQFVVVIDGIETQKGRNDKPESLNFKGNIRVDEVKFQPYYSCAINYTTEVVVRDTYASGSTVGLKTLSFTPIKFCPQDLGVLIVSNQGLTDEKGSITESISKGTDLIVPDSQYWQVDYITKYVDSMKEKCGVGQAYDTKSQKCVSVASQQVSTPTLLYCAKDSDCAIPINCNDATVSCVNNQCDYRSTICTKEQIINYVLVETTIDISEPKVNVLNNGVMTVYFGMPAIVAGKNFDARAVTPLKDLTNCQVANGEYLSTSKEGCYEISVTWGDYSFKIKNGEEKTISDGIKVKYTASGRGAFNGVKDGVTWNYEFIKAGDISSNFQLTLSKVLDVSLSSYNEKYDLNSDAKLTINMVNKLFDISDSGYMIKVSKSARDIYLQNDQVFQPFKKGTSSVIVKLPTDEIGLYTVEITPFLNVLNNQQYMVKQIIASYYVDVPSKNDCHNTPCSIGECQDNGDCVITPVSSSTTNQTPTPNYLIYIVIGGVILIAVLLFNGKKK